MRADIRMDDPETKAYIDHIRSPAYKQELAAEQMPSKIRQPTMIMDMKPKPIPGRPPLSSVTRLPLTSEKQLRARTVLGTMKNYGYVHARFRRAALLHRFLSAHRLQAIAADPRKAVGKYSFSIAWFYKEMPVSLYFQIIGIRKVNNVLHTFLEQHTMLEIPLDYVSASVAAQIFPIGASFHRKLWQSIMVLYRLGLVDMDLDVENDTKPNSIEINSCGVVKDYKLTEPKETAVHHFHNMEEVRSYWIALEAECINPKIPEGSILRVCPPTDGERDRSELSSTLDHIGLSRNWNSSAIKTWAHQICVATYLDSFCDEVAHTTPLADITKCHEIAASIEISYVEVRQHYRKKEAKYRIQENKVKSGVTEEFGAFRVKLPSTIATAQSKRKAEARLQDLKDRIEWKAHQLQQNEEEIDSEDREERLPLMPEEIEKILHWCVVMDKNASSAEGPTASVVEASTGLKPSKVRYGLKSLMKHTHWRERKAQLDSIWTEMYTRGIELGLYADGPKTEKALTNQFQYFYNESAKVQA